jgi:predicted transposase/invertase (TIGR01784 family)
MMIQNDVLDTNRLEGEIEGHRRGKEEGLREGKYMVAKNMKQMGIAIDVISAVTGLSEDEVRKI